MEKYVVLVEAHPYCASGQAAFDKLRTGNLEIIDMRGKGVQDPEFMSALKTAHILLAGNDIHVTRDLLADLPKLKMIGKFGVGLDAIDLGACTEKGVIVCNSPGCNTQAVADQAMGMLLALMRFIPEGDNALRRGHYSHTGMIGREIWQKTMGIVGLGAIGRAVAERAKGFRMNIIGFDPYWPEEFASANNIKRVHTVSEMLPACDILTLHCNLTEENKGMIGEKELATMKPHAVLVNTARGGLIDETALFHALKKGVVAGAAIDAWAEEPPAGSPLLSLRNVVVMPHSAAFTVESLQNMDMMVTDQILAFSRGEQPQPTVNKVAI